MTGEEHRLECVYWPRGKGPWFMVEDATFDEGELLDELSHVADIGFGAVRLSLPWEALHPSPERLTSAILDRLAALLDAAWENGLKIRLALAGQLGGTLFLPRWLLRTDPSVARLTTEHRVISAGWESPLSPADIYSERLLLDAQRYLWREVAHNFGGHPALVAVDIGVGGILGAIPPRGPEDALQWAEAMREAPLEGGQVGQLSYSDGPALLLHGRMPRLAPWVEQVERLAISASPATSPLARDGIDTMWPRFLLLLAQRLAGAPVGCASLGVPTEPDSTALRPSDNGELLTTYHEAEQASFFAETVPALFSLGTPTLCHAVWADAPRDLWTQPPLDRAIHLRYSGLLRADGREKEVTAIFRSLSARVGEEHETSPQRLELDPDEWYSRRGEPGFIKNLYTRYLAGEL